MIVLAAVIGLPLAVLGVVYALVPTVKGAGHLIRHMFGFLGAMVTDLVRLLGHVLTAVVFSFLVVGYLLFARVRAAEHFAEAFRGELIAAGLGLYRLVIGHPLRLLFLGSLLEGIEKRVPAAIRATPDGTAAATLNSGGGSEQDPWGVLITGLSDRQASPGAETTAFKRAPAGRPIFEGYSILGTLASGGSGGRLYVARPSPEKLTSFELDAAGLIGDVVIKSFSIREGSTLPQIVRESRSLEAAKKLGLVLEHDLTGERFHYVMRFVPGMSLSLVTHQLHAQCTPEAGGLDALQLHKAVSYVCDLVATLDQYHAAGLWHKDIKPDNIIVHDVDDPANRNSTIPATLHRYVPPDVVNPAPGGRAHLVDFGLLTPLRSSMTLTTHGTEYFRDPEMVRLALRGVKVADVDGAKFDVYGAGAVLYSIVEGSFPAHGALSRITKRCPDVVKWIIRRAMADYDKRYPTTRDMLGDLLFALRACGAGRVVAEKLAPADLPSVRVRATSEPTENSLWMDASTPSPTAFAALSSLLPVYPPPPPPFGRFSGKGANGQAADVLVPEHEAEHFDLLETTTDDVLLDAALARAGVSDEFVLDDEAVEPRAGRQSRGAEREALRPGTFVALPDERRSEIGEPAGDSGRSGSGVGAGSALQTVTATLPRIRLSGGVLAAVGVCAFVVVVLLILAVRPAMYSGYRGLTRDVLQGDLAAEFGAGLPLATIMLGGSAAQRGIIEPSSGPGGAGASASAEDGTTVTGTRRFSPDRTKLATGGGKSVIQKIAQGAPALPTLLAGQRAANDETRLLVVRASSATTGPLAGAVAAYAGSITRAGFRVVGLDAADNASLMLLDAVKPHTGEAQATDADAHAALANWLAKPLTLRGVPIQPRFVPHGVVWCDADERDSSKLRIVVIPGPRLDAIAVQRLLSALRAVGGASGGN